MNRASMDSGVTAWQGLKIGLFMATCFAIVVLLERLALGPGAFQRFGLNWLTIVAVYYVTLSIGGLAFGALSRRRMNPVGAVARGVSLMLPGYVVFTSLIGVTTGRLPSYQTGIVLGVVMGVFGGSILGLWLWIDDTKRRAPTARERL